MTTAGVGPITKCRHCGAPIRHVVLDGVRHAVDAERLSFLMHDGAAGTPSATLVDDQGVLHRGVLDGPDAERIEGYAPHWPRCR